MSTATQAFTPGSVLSDLWNTGLSTFEKWTDYEFGADVALEQENRASAAMIEAEQSPVQDHTAVQAFGQRFSGMTLALVAGAGLLILFLLRR